MPFRDLPIHEAHLTHEVAIYSETLKLRFDDPADRFLVATALVHGLTLVTGDRRLLKSRHVPTLSN